MSIKLSHDQETAVDAISRWLKSSDPVFTLAGYAGTGKTTILRNVVEGASNAICATPTGKAASVLRSKLGEDGPEVGTLHSLLYCPIEVTELDVAMQVDEVRYLEAAGLPVERAEKRLERLIKKLETGACEFGFKGDGPSLPLVVVDECSMVGDQVERDLLRSAEKVLFVGDPGQLPPVEGREFFERNRPNATLENIHRQAAGSSILQLAHAVRHGEAFDGWDENCVSGDRSDLGTLLEADQIITGMNQSRRRLNTRIRAELGFRGEFPRKGEAIICLRNDNERGLINGVGGVAASDCGEDEYGALRCDVAYEDRFFQGLPMDRLAFDQYDNPKLTRRDVPTNRALAQFDLGHAITAHKAQGSEWDHVVVWDDKMRRHDKEARRRWIYTSATRAACKLTWISAG